MQSIAQQLQDKLTVTMTAQKSLLQQQIKAAQDRQQAFQTQVLALLQPRPMHVAEESLPQSDGSQINPEERFNSEPSMVSLSSDDTLKSSLRAKDLPKFHGNTSGKLDVDDWIKQVNAIWRHAGTKEEHLIAWLPLLLQDQAFDWFTSLEAEGKQLSTWAEWQTALRNAFRGPNYLDELESKLQYRRLEDNESVNDYFRDKTALLSKRYGRTVSPSFKVQEVIRGLPYQMQSLVKACRGQTPKDNSLEALRRLLIDLEPGMRPNKRFASKQPVNQASNGKDKDNSTVTCYGCGSVGHYRNECPRQQDA